MAKQDPIPTTDQDFDTLQGILVTKVFAPFGRPAKRPLSTIHFAGQATGKGKRF